MKKLTFLILFLFTTGFYVAISVAVNPAANAHSITTASGHVLVDKKEHWHNTYCTPGSFGCAAGSNSAVESKYGFKAADRIYGSNVTWNCHGRTFDNRGSWIPYAEPYLQYDSPFTPSKPAIGDAIVFWDSANRTSHTVTIVGTWNGTSTLVMSKYGPQGQYKHALSNTIRAYPGHKYGVVRFAAGTKIHLSIADNKDLVALPFSRLLAFNGDVPLLNATTVNDLSSSHAPFDVDKFLEKQSTLPWYQEAMEETKALWQEHQQIVDRVAKMSDANRKLLSEAKTDDQRVKILLSDLNDNDRFAILSLYNAPGQTEHFFDALEAKKLLIDLLAKNKALKGKVVSELKLTAKNGHKHFGDQKKGMSLYLLGNLLNDQEKAVIKKELPSLLASPAMVPESYEHFYRNRL